MNVSLDQMTEQRIQREMERGHFHSPEEVIAQALSLLEEQQEWLLSNRDDIRDRIEASFEQVQRGEYLSGDDARSKLAAMKKTTH